ncbi:hypothetical protein OAN33_07805 [Flavobacteriales bacterium]|nr:hypothetical protein [Flavobacteriales bacterium]
MKGTIQNIFIGLTLLTLTIPALLALLDVKLVENCEKRELHTLPTFSISEKFIDDFENYFDDNFGLRNSLINWGSSIKVNLFKSSVHPQNVKFGKSGWLFYNKIDGGIFNSYAHRNLLSNEELKSLVEVWENRKINLESKGIKYIMAVWPNKSTIYPEHIPLTMKAQIKDTLSKTDQILNFLHSSKSSIPFIAARSKLMEEKKKNQLYRKLDTHWNQVGAFYAYQYFMEKTSDILGVVPYNLEDFTIKYHCESKGDLLSILGICETNSFSETNPTLQLTDNNLTITKSEGKYKNSLTFKNKKCDNRLKVLIFRDSFTDALIPFFKNHFYETHFVWFDYQKHIVDTLKPDIVITSFVERNI